MQFKCSGNYQIHSILSNVPSTCTMCECSTRMRRTLETEYQRAREQMDINLDTQRKIHNRRVHCNPLEKGELVRYLHVFPSQCRNRSTGTGPVGSAQAGPIFVFDAILKLLFGWSFSIETIKLVSTLFQSLSQ